MPAVIGTNFGTVTSPPANAQVGDRMQFATAPVNVFFIVTAILGNGFFAFVPVAVGASALPIGWTSTRPVSITGNAVGPGIGG